MSEIQREVPIHKALSHPARLHIMRALFQFCEMNQQVLSQKLGIQKNTLIRHLRILEAAEIVTSRRKGNFIYYYLQEF